MNGAQDRWTVTGRHPGHGPVRHNPRGSLAERIGYTPKPWEERALCAQTDPELFFPDKGANADEAKAVCARCPVAAECLDDALADPHDRFGIRGGLTERQRRKIRKQLASEPEQESA